MVDRSETKVPRFLGTKGRSRFAAFLEKNEISGAAAGEALRVSRMTISDYLRGWKRPGEGKRREDIETWTDGKVRAEDWLLPNERTSQSRVRPFAKTGTDS